MSDLTRRAIGINVKHKRIAQGLSLEKLAQQSAIPLEELDKLENSEGDFPVEYLFRLAPILHFRISDMVTCKEKRRARLGALSRLLGCDIQEE